MNMNILAYDPYISAEQAETEPSPWTWSSC